MGRGVTLFCGNGSLVISGATASSESDYATVTTIASTPSPTLTIMGGTVYYGQSYPLIANVFTKSGYSFIGWNMQADGKGTAYAPGAILTGTENSKPSTLYAQWSSIGNGNTGGGSGGGAVSTPRNETLKPSTAGDTTSVKPAISSTTASATVSKETMTAVIDAAMAAAEKSKSTANDFNAVKWVTEKGIIGGNADGTLNPTGTATRAEVATMFTNYRNVT